MFCFFNALGCCKVLNKSVFKCLVEKTQVFAMEVGGSCVFGDTTVNYIVL